MITFRSLIHTCCCAGAIVIGVAASAGAQPYQMVGKAKCINCHDHESEKIWSEKKDGPPPNNHLNALRQLEMPKAEAFAKAIGLADPYDAKGSCAACHGTTLKGNVIDGVTCESCHGAASGYVDLHQQKGAYRQSVALGLADTQKNPDAWAPMCVKCHVLADAKLIQAGHPSGDDFDLGAKFATVALHWKSIYPNKADIAARARTARVTIVASRGPMAAPAATAPAAAPVVAATTASSAFAAVPSPASATAGSANIECEPELRSHRRAFASGGARAGGVCVTEGFRATRGVGTLRGRADYLAAADTGCRPGAAALAVGGGCRSAGTPDHAARQPAAPRRARRGPHGAAASGPLSGPRRGVAAPAG